MYKLNQRIEIKLRFLKHGEYGEKIYEDCLGTTFIWFSKSDKLEYKNWFNVSAKLYEGLDGDGNLSYLRLFNPREIK